MMGEEVNLSDIVGSDIWDESGNKTFEMLPEGTYHGQVLVVEGPTKNKNGDGFWLRPQFVIVSEPHIGRRLSTYISLKSSALWKLQEFLRAMGKEAGEVTYTPGEFDGNLCTLRVKIRPAEGEYSARNEIANILPLAEDADVSAW